MTLNFPNVEILGLDQQSRFFNGGFQYSNLQRISVRGLVIDLINGLGVTGIWSGSEGIVSTISNNSNFQALSLNGYNFGSGRIQNINFDSSNDVRIKSYSANLLVYNTGNLYNFNTTNGFYSGIDINNFQYLESFSENYSFERKQNGGYSYNHAANMTFNSGLGLLASIPEAKNVVKTFFTGSQLGFLFYSGFTNVIGKRFYTESYDLISNACNFSESFDFDDYTISQPNLAGTYSSTRTNSYQLLQNGNITVTENGTIRGITYPTYKAALAALSGEMTGAYYRCSGVFVLYAPPGATLFINAPIVQGRTFDLFNNILTYTMTFSNDPDVFGGYLWNYTDSLQRQNGIIRISENGNIQGRNGNRMIAFNAALQAWSGIKNTINPRMSGLFLGIDPTCVFFQESEQNAYSPFKSVINYDYTYTNEQVLYGQSGIKDMSVVIEDNYPIYQYNKVGIFNVAEIEQNAFQSRLGTRMVEITARGEKIVPLSTYLANIQTGFNSYIPNSNAYVTNSTYSFSPDDNMVKANITWNYPYPAQQTINL